MLKSDSALNLKASLISFEHRVAGAFERGEIHAPVHLSGGNEDQLIEIFCRIRPQDWVLSTWRSHYHALLKGVPEGTVYKEILAGHSMYIESAKHNFLSSSIVAGILPIGLGLAMAAKWQGRDQQVWCFIGDMASYTGLYAEVSRYAANFRLPLNIVIEDNGLSTNTPTRKVWGFPFTGYNGVVREHYSYVREFPHVGMGTWVTFG